MATLDVLNTEKKKVGSVNVPDAVFAAEVNEPLVHQVLNAQLASRRQGTHKTKTRGEVQGGGKKPFRQKGTGNARQGSSRSSLQVGGGTSFGPQPRSYVQSTPKKMVQGALRSVISDRLKSERLMVIDEIKLSEAKTKKFAELVGKKLGLEKALIVDEANDSLELASRNFHGSKVLRTDGLNVYDVLKHEWLVLSKKAAEAIGNRLSPEAQS